MSNSSAFDGVAAPAGGVPLRARTLEILWHCSERTCEAERFGVQGGGGLVEGVTSIDLCVHNQRIVTTGGDGCIRVWQLQASALDAWLDSSANDMAACAVHVCAMRNAWMPIAARWSALGNRIATAHCDGAVCLWWPDRASTAADAPAGSLEEWKPQKQLTGHISDVYDIAFSPDSRYLLSGASDGSITIHDLEGSPRPIVQLNARHSKFCRGVAWDPWNRMFHSFGCGPSLLVYQWAPPHRAGGSPPVAAPRKCQGEFVGESCALSFRRLAWSPDGLLLAVPYGRPPHRQHHHHHPAVSGSPDVDGSPYAQPSEASIFDAIDAKAASCSRAAEPDEAPVGMQSPLPDETRANAYAPVADAPRNSGDGGSGGSHACHTSAESHRNAGQDGDDDEEEEEEVAGENGGSDSDGEEYYHCINIYTRSSPDKLAARLSLKGFNEVRGVQWAPCVLEPLPPKEPLPFVLPREDHAQSAAAAATAAQSHTSPAASSPTPTPTPETDAAAPLEKNGGASAADSPARTSAWGPGDYRMALAAWTSETVVVFTTDSPGRHSEYADLHMRSITDIAWSGDAAFILTASLDGYVSVIGFGSSLTVAHRLPLFSPRATTRALCALLQAIRDESEAAERGQSSKVDSAAPATMAPVVRKKRRVEKTDIALTQLEGIVNGSMAE